VGRVQNSVYLSYLRAWSSIFYWVPIMVLCLALSERGLQVAQNFVLSSWANAVAAAEAVGQAAATKWVDRGSNNSCHPAASLPLPVYRSNT